MGKISIGISIVCGIIATILFFGYVLPSNLERQESTQNELDEAITELDRIVNKAIVHCETDGLGCDVTMPQWLEACKEPDMKDIPSCHDGRIEELMKSRVVTMSNECHLRLAMIQKYVITDEILVVYGPNYYDEERNDAISYFEELCGDYETLFKNQMTKQVTSQECDDLKEIMDLNRYENSNATAIDEFFVAWNDYKELGCS